MILSTGDDGDAQFTRPKDLDLIQSVPSVDLLNMKAPPRVLTLTEQPLDSLETDPTANSQSNPSHVVSEMKVSIQCPFLFIIISHYTFRLINMNMILCSGAQLYNTVLRIMQRYQLQHSGNVYRHKQKC